MNTLPIKVCPHCGIDMVKEVASYPMGSAMMKDRFFVDIYCCPQCKRVNLFAAESDMVTCPVCGTRHHRNEACVVCAINRSYDFEKKDE